MRNPATILAIVLSATLAATVAFADTRVHSSDSDYSWSENGRGLSLHSHGASGIVVDRTNPVPFHGLRPGDVIVAVDGHAVTQVNDLLKAVRGHDTTPMTMRVHRAGSDVTLSWTHAEFHALFPSPPQPPPPPPAPPPR